MHIGELSRRTGASLRSLRYYEEKRLLTPERRENGYREYAEDDIGKVGLIQLYFGLGLTANEILDFFVCAFDNGVKRECLPNAIRLGENKLREIKKQIGLLREAEARLETSVKEWKSLLGGKEERL